MAKITTEDCRNFLVSCYQPGTYFRREIDDDLADSTARIHMEEDPKKIVKYLTQLLADVQNPKKWRRDEKYNPAKEDDEVYVCVDLATDKYETQPASNYRWLRRFYLDPNRYDTSVAWEVLEHKDGTLHLGDNVSD